MTSTANTDVGDVHDRWRRWAGPVILTLVFCALMAWTWRKWPHVLVDFGRELYVPWRLSEGDVLYRDIAYFNGPLSPYFNSALFSAFGVSMTTLVAANAVLLALLLVMIYRTLARTCDRLAATIACLVLLCMFAFAQIDMAGNYNYICPYSHEMTHGLFLSFVMLWLLDGTRRSEGVTSWLCIAAAGFVWGMVFLGKAEIFIAATGAAAIALAIPLLYGTVSRSRWLLHLASFAVAGIVPAALFAGALSTQMPLGESLLGVAGSWRWILGSDVSSQHFYRATLGLDKPLFNLLKMLQVVTRVGLIVAAVVLVDYWHAGGRRKKLAIVFVGLCLLGTVLLRERLFPYLVEGRLMLVSAIVTVGALAVAAWRLRDRRQDMARYATLLPWAVLGLLLMAKLLLLPRIHHYGFVLAMPAGVLGVACMVAFAPKLLRIGWGGGKVFRIAIVGLLLLDAMAYVLLCSDHFGRKSYSVAQGGDQIAAENPDVSPIGPVVNEVLAEIEASLPRDATIVALPEGVMLNYLSRRKSPSRFINLMPPELLAYGHDQILRNLQEARPDYVLLIHKDTSEYGVQFFGSPEYGRQITRWVARNYEPLRVFGRQPFQDPDGFGIALLSRIEPDFYAAGRQAGR